MKQYLRLLNKIKETGTYKPAARENMPGTKSLFGYQFCHKLSDGFPLLTTKNMSMKNISTELIWFLRGDTNIKFLVDNNCNIWNEDAYNYYCKKCKLYRVEASSYNEWLSYCKESHFGEKLKLGYNYKYGDCGHQYGKVWRNFGDELDQIKNILIGLIDHPESRRHILTAIDPLNENDVALYWCHAMVQFNCRPLTFQERKHLCNGDTSGILCTEDIDYLYKGIPKYYLDCQLYQRSADSFLGVPYNIASYALLTHIFAAFCNMIPGDFIHTFGDVHIYDNHQDAVDTQLEREPRPLPTLVFRNDFNFLVETLSDGNSRLSTKDRVTIFLDAIQTWDSSVFIVDNYNPYPTIKAELSTGLKK